MLFIKHSIIIIIVEIKYSWLQLVNVLSLQYRRNGLFMYQIYCIYTILLKELWNICRIKVFCNPFFTPCLSIVYLLIWEFLCNLFRGYDCRTYRRGSDSIFKLFYYSNLILLQALFCNERGRVRLVIFFIIYYNR